MVASMPFKSGILHVHNDDMRDKLPGQGNGPAAVLGLGHHLHVRFPLQQSA